MSNEGLANFYCTSGMIRVDWVQRAWGWDLMLFHKEYMGRHATSIKRLEDNETSKTMDVDGVDTCRPNTECNIGVVVVDSVVELTEGITAHHVQKAPSFICCTYR